VPRLITRRGIRCCGDNDQAIAELPLHTSSLRRMQEWPARWTKEMAMADGLISKPPGARAAVRKGQSGNPAGRKVGCRDKATIAAPAPTRNGVCSWSRPTVQVGQDPQPASPARAGPCATTHRGDSAVDLLQMAGHETIDSIVDCRRPTPVWCIC